MSAAAGAPPPPPPPRRTSGFDNLPAELLLMLFESLGLEQFINLALVIYPTLTRHGMAPELSEKTAMRIIDTSGLRFPLPAAAVDRMPAELWLHIVADLEPANGIALMFAIGPRCWRFRGRPSEELRNWLRVWSQRNKKSEK